MFTLPYHSALVESHGYCRLTRIQEIMDFAHRCGYSHLGLAFCVGLAREARAVSQIFREHGFQVNSVICKNGSIPKEFIGIIDSEKVRPSQEEAICNPIGQALLLNDCQTELNFCWGCASAMTRCLSNTPRRR